MLDDHLVSTVFVEITAIVNDAYRIDSSRQVVHIHGQDLSVYQSAPLLGRDQLTELIVDPHLQILESGAVHTDVELASVRIGEEHCATTCQGDVAFVASRNLSGSGIGSGTSILVGIGIGQDEVTYCRSTRDEVKAGYADSRPGSAHRSSVEGHRAIADTDALVEQVSGTHDRSRVDGDRKGARCTQTGNSTVGKAWRYGDRSYNRCLGGIYRCEGGDVTRSASGQADRRCVVGPVVNRSSYSTAEGDSRSR